MIHPLALLKLNGVRGIISEKTQVGLKEVYESIWPFSKEEEDFINTWYFKRTKSEELDIYNKEVQELSIRLKYLEKNGYK